MEASVEPYHRHHQDNNQIGELVEAHKVADHHIQHHQEEALEEALVEALVEAFVEAYHQLHHHNNQQMEEVVLEACRKVVHIQQVVVAQDMDTVVAVVVVDNMVRDIFSYNDEHRLVGKLLGALVVLGIQADLEVHCILEVQEVPYIQGFQGFQGIQQVPSFQVDLALVVVEVADSIVAELVDILHHTRLG